jgi:type I restriction enzyme S subunit
MSVVSMPKDSTLAGPYQLPREWRWSLLEDIAEVVGGVTKGQKFGPDDELVEVPYLRVANVQREHLRLEEILRITTTKQKADALRLLPGDILLNEGGDRDKLGRGWVWGGEIPDCVHQNHVFRARILNGLPPKFVSFYANSIGQAFFFEKAKQTTNLASISLSKIRQLPVPVPPHDVANEIVAQLEARLSRIDKATADLRSVEAKLARHRASVLAAATSGTLVPTEADLARREGRTYEPATVLLARILAERRTRWEAEQIASFRAKGKIPGDDKWKAKYQPPVAPDTVDLPALPEGWTWTSMDHLLADIEAGASFQCEERKPKAGEIGVLKVSAVTWGEYDENETKTCTTASRIDKSLFIQPGDFLFSRANTIDLVGACAIAKCVTFPAMLSDKTLRFRFVDEAVAQWVLACLRSKHGRTEIQRLATGNQESMRNIGQGRIRSLRIPMPPAGEMRRLVPALEQHKLNDERLAAAGQRAARHAAALRSAILQAAFQPPAVA